jgi:hypothetical protein
MQVKVEGENPVEFELFYEKGGLPVVVGESLLAMSIIERNPSE